MANYQQGESIPYKGNATHPIQEKDGPYQYSWAFSDGGTATGQYVEHTYSTMYGDVSAELTVFNETTNETVKVTETDFIVSPGVTIDSIVINDDQPLYMTTSSSIPIRVNWSDPGFEYGSGYDSENNTSHTIRYDFDDGTYVVRQKGGVDTDVTTKTYSTTGPKTVTIRVINKITGMSDLEVSETFYVGSTSVMLGQDYGTYAPIPTITSPTYSETHEDAQTYHPITGLMTESIFRARYNEDITADCEFTPEPGYASSDYEICWFVNIDNDDTDTPTSIGSNMATWLDPGITTATEKFTSVNFTYMDTWYSNKRSVFLFAYIRNTKTMIAYKSDPFVVFNRWIPRLEFNAPWSVTRIYSSIPPNYTEASSSAEMSINGTGITYPSDCDGDFSVDLSSSRMSSFIRGENGDLPVGWVDLQGPNYMTIVRYMDSPFYQASAETGVSVGYAAKMTLNYSVNPSENYQQNVSVVGDSSTANVVYADGASTSEDCPANGSVSGTSTANGWTFVTE